MVLLHAENRALRPEVATTSHVGWVATRKFDLKENRWVTTQSTSRSPEQLSDRRYTLSWVTTPVNRISRPWTATDRR